MPSLKIPNNQVLSLWNPIGETANAVMGLMEDQLAPNPHELDKNFLPRGWIMYLKGKKGERVREWNVPNHEDYLKMDGESERRAMEFIRINPRWRALPLQASPRQGQRR